MVFELMKRALLTAIIATGCGVFTTSSGRCEPAPFMMQATVGGRVLEGQPLAWTDRQMLLLGRDGALYEFAPAEAADAKKTGAGFTAYSAAEIQSRLRAEFGEGFDVTITVHFVVVHPRGPGREWAERLESLYRSFTHYMSVRGFPATAPSAPLVAIVFRNQDDYFAHAAARGIVLQPETVGHYDPITNRVFLFDASASSGGADWAANAATIIHEAAHQTAYNVGVHRRFAEQPRWAVEGLAMMFEARGVWDASPVRQQADRINRERLDCFRRTRGERPADWLVRLAASDVSFDSNALTAYAEAWTLTFYLCETRPQEYSAYLGRVAARAAFSRYPAMERMRDFTAVFGGDVGLLAAQLQRYVDGLP